MDIVVYENSISKSKFNVIYNISKCSETEIINIKQVESKLHTAKRIYTLNIDEQTITKYFTKIDKTPYIFKLENTIPELSTKFKGDFDENGVLEKVKSNMNQTTNYSILAIEEMFKKEKKTVKTINEIPSINYKAYYSMLINKSLIDEQFKLTEFYNFFKTQNSLFVEDSFIKFKETFNNIFNYIEAYYKFTSISMCNIRSDQFPPALRKLVQNQSVDSYDLKHIQYVPTMFQYYGNSIELFIKKSKFAIIGTRKVNSIELVRSEIAKIRNKYNGVCISGLAEGVDTLGSEIFKNSIVFIAEPISGILTKKERNILRFNVKKKILNSGVIYSHVMPHVNQTKGDIINSLLDRNLFVVLTADSVHPIKFGMKSGTINAINHAILNNKPIYTPKKMVSDEIVEKYQNKIKFY